jgi:hypothetical protein
LSTKYSFLGCFLGPSRPSCSKKLARAPVKTFLRPCSTWCRSLHCTDRQDQEQAKAWSWARQIPESHRGVPPFQKPLFYTPHKKFWGVFWWRSGSNPLFTVIVPTLGTGFFCFPVHFFGRGTGFFAGTILRLKIARCRDARKRKAENLSRKGVFLKPRPAPNGTQPSEERIAVCSAFLKAGVTLSSSPSILPAS